MSNTEKINIGEDDINQHNIKEQNNIKKIVIIDEPLKNKNKNKNIKRINCEKETKLRVETKTWGLNEDELSYQTQLHIIHNILDTTLEKDKYVAMFLAHIKNKIGGYKQQDILKKKLNEQQLVKFKEVVELLTNCEMKCHYCSEQMFILYEKVREKKQWTLDRINNDIGHNNGNLVVACLECNLKRRRTNKDAFMFTKNMVIVREGLI
jgi:hypothetical protein